MRELQFNFLKGREIVPGIDERRNYYYFELDELEKKEFIQQSGVNKKVQIYMYDEILIEKEIVFDGDSFINQILDCLQPFRDPIKDIIKRESELIEDDKFRRFLIRYDEVLCHPKVKPFPFILDIEKMYALYRVIDERIGHLFYSNLAKLMRTIANLCRLLVKMMRGENEELRKSFYRFLNDEQNFEKFCSYVPASLMSLSSDRIDALYPIYEPYQQIQRLLFEKLPFFIDFNECLCMHKSLIVDFNNEFHKELLSGEIFSEDGHFEMKVLSPVINKYFRNIKDTIEDLAREQGVDASELYVI